MSLFSEILKDFVMIVSLIKSLTTVEHEIQVLIMQKVIKNF